MLQKSDAAQGRVRPEARQRSTPKAQIAVERRRGQRLLNAWHSARGEHLFPSFAALEAAADSELMHHSVLLRVGARGQLTIERFGPPVPTGAIDSGKENSDVAPVVTPVVVTWILSVAAAALRRRAPVTESDEVPLGSRFLCYRCAVVPISSNGAEVDGLVGVLGYRWAADAPKPK